jgi:hypothetical protein
MFVDKMPDCHNPKHVQILRAKANRPVKGIMAGNLVRAMTHWFKGRTLPCVGTSNLDCPLCQKGIASRYYSYLPLRGRLGLAAVVELTSSAERELIDGLKCLNVGSVAVVTVSRASGKANNPLHVDLEFKQMDPEEYGKFFSKRLDNDLIKRALCKLWGCPEWEPGVNEGDWFLIVQSYLEQVVEGNV